MKTTTLFGWPGLEPPDIRPFRRQVRNLLLEWRWLQLRLWPGWRWLGVVMALFGPFALFVYAGPALRFFDPTAAVVDIGALSLLLLAVVALAAFLTVSRWLLGLLWPVLRSYQQHHFSNNFRSLSPWQKITFYLVIFFGLLYAFVWCLVAVF